MTTRWTAEQNSAIQAANSNLLVSAGAGSGKTAVLVNRILRLLLEEAVPVDRLLVVTFTKAAAGEMKERLRRELVSRMAVSPELVPLIRGQLHRLNHAWITTFHGFCRQLLQRHFQEAGLEPRFRVLDTPEAEQLRSLAVGEVLEAAYEAADPAFIHWAECYSGNRTDQRLEAMILDLHSFIHSQPAPWQWTDRILETYELPLDGENPWFRHEQRRRREMILEAMELLNRAVELAEDPEGPSEYLGALSDDMLQAIRLEECLELDHEAWKACVSGMSRSRLSPVSKARKVVLSSFHIEMVKALRDEGWGILKKLQEKAWIGAGSRAESDLKAVAGNCKVLTELVRNFDAAYDAHKSRLSAVDYSDLEHKALRLLQSEALCSQYREQFVYLFIDEYQDSNGVQETLLKALQRENNRFMVGDVKQSIYRFRLAEPLLFVGKLAASSHEENTLHRRIDLNRNFRSRKEVIDTINAVFEATMSSELGDVPYDAGARLIPGADYPPGAATNVQLTVLDLGSSEGEEGSDGSEYTTAEWEARAIGRKILEVVGTPVWDIRTNQWRTAVWDDIAVLLRAVKPWLNTLSRVFSEMGIPIKAEGATGSDEAWELWVLINVLRLVGNSQQDLPLMVVLRSPLGGFSVEDLAEIRRSMPEGTFRKAVETAVLEESPLKDKLTAFLARLAAWQEQCRTGSLGSFIWTLCETEGFMNYCQAMASGESRKERLLWAVRQADQRALRGADTPESLATHLETLVERGEAPGAADSGEHGGVRTMSIHRSKGLEFPIVFLAGLGKKFNTADLREEVLRHRELGFGLRYVDPERRIRRGTLLTELIQDAVKSENLSEEMRILYVAMTRAMDRLYMYGSVQNLEKRFGLWMKGPELFFLKNAQSYLEWLLPPLLKITMESEPWNGAREINAGDSVLQVNFLSPFQSIGIRETVNLPAQKSVSEEKLWHLENWPWEYPWAQATHIPSKLSVTEINRLNTPAGEAVPFGSAVRVSGSQVSGLTGAETGTLHHLVLQHLDFRGTLDEAGIAAQLETLVRKEILAPEDPALIRVDWLTGLFRSDIGKRLLGSSEILKEVPFVILRDYQDLGGDAAGDVLVQGIIDCCFKEPEGWVLLDYKTDSVTAPLDIAEKYGWQIRLYGDALAELTGEPVKESWLYLMRSEEALQIKPDDK